MKPALLLLPLVAGLATGAVGAWSLRQNSPLVQSGDIDSAALSADEPPLGPGAILVTPPRLTTTEADTALADWLAQPQLSEQSPPAEVAARRAILRALLTRLPDDRLPLLLDGLVTRADKTEGNLRWHIFKVWTERDAPAAARWALAQTAPNFVKDNQRTYLSNAIDAWAETDFDAAYAWSTALTDSTLADHLAQRLLVRLAKTDPAQAIALAGGRGSTFYNDARENLFVAWSRQSPADALRWFGSTENISRNNHWSYHNAVVRWLAQSPQAAFDWLTAPDAPNDKSGRPMIEAIGYQLVDNPAATQNLAKALLNPDTQTLPDRDRALTTLVGYWQRKDGDAALAWLDDLKDPALKIRLVEQIGDHWISSSQPETKIEFNLRLPEGSNRTEKIAETLSKWAETAPDEAMAWLDAHPDPTLANAAEAIQATLVGKLAATNPQAAIAQWETLVSEQAKSTALKSLTENWAKQNPTQAANWLLQQVGLKEAQALNPQDALREIVSNWAAQSPQDALRWVETIEDERLRRNAQYALTNSNRYDADSPDPAERAQLFATVEDESLRKNLLQSHARNWLRTDYQAASDWLSASEDFTPEQVAEMLVANDPYKR